MAAEGHDAPSSEHGTAKLEDTNAVQRGTCAQPERWRDLEQCAKSQAAARRSAGDDPDRRARRARFSDVVDCAFLKGAAGRRVNVPASGRHDTKVRAMSFQAART
jgi:hypothetical protein